MRLLSFAHVTSCSQAVYGPRIDPGAMADLPCDGVTFTGHHPELPRVLAACDLAVVQGGLATTMELLAARRPGDLGVLRLAISEVHVASGQSTITLRYRGSTLETHLEAGLRLECVATDGQARSCRSVETRTGQLRLDGVGSGDRDARRHGVARAGARPPRRARRAADVSCLAIPASRPRSCAPGLSCRG